MKSREHLNTIDHLDIYCIWCGYLTFRLSGFSLKTVQFVPNPSLQECKNILIISLNMKSRDHINTIDRLDIYCISRGYLTFPQKPQKIFKFCLH